MLHRTTRTVPVLAVAMFALMCSAAAKAQEHKLILTSEAGDRNSVLGEAMRRWAALIAERSDGRIIADVFYQGELGGQQELFDQLVKGNVHLMITWPQTSYDPRIAVNYVPYMVMGWEDAVVSFGDNGWIRDVMEPVYTDIGIKYFGPFPEGFGGIATKDTYATSYEAATEKGIKVRSQPIFPLPQTIQAMGFEAVPIDWAEVYTSLQTGVVDGDSSNVIYWDYEYFRDQLDYFVQSSHNFSSYSLVMSAKTWAEMEPADREIIESAASEVIAKQFEDAKAEDDKWIAAAQDSGMEYIVPTPEEKAAWVERVRAEVWPQVEAALGPEIMNAIRENATIPSTSPDTN